MIRLISAVTVALATALAGAGLAAADVPEPTAATAVARTLPTLTVTGTLRVVPDAADGGFWLMTDAGDLLTLTGDDLAGATTGDRFAGELVLPAGAAVSPADRAALHEGDVSASSALGRRVIAALVDADEPVAASGTVTSSTAASSELTKQKHKVYPIVTTSSGDQKCDGKCGISENDVETMVDEVDKFWRDMSEGKIRYKLKDANGGSSGKIATLKANPTLCDDTGTLWEQSATKVANKVGWGTPPGGASDTYYFGLWTNSKRDARHLLMLQPDCAAYGDMLGLGTVPKHVDQGGAVMSVAGAADTNAASVAAHEFGHNMSLWHAQYLDCGAQPTGDVNTSKMTADGYGGDPSKGGCTEYDYTDTDDMMGYSLAGSDVSIYTKGMLGVSAPALIRTGMLAGGDYAKPTPDDGQPTITLNSLTSDGGKRAIRVRDPKTDDRYFIEWRNGDGTDTNGLYANGNGGTGFAFVGGPATLNVWHGPGVRVLREDQQKASVLLADWQGRAHPGAAQWRETGMVAGEEFRSRSGKLRVRVVSISGAEAAVQIVFVVKLDNVKKPSIKGLSDGDAVVGTTLTAKPGKWKGYDIAFDYAWKVGSTVVGTGATYVPTPELQGEKLRVAVTATNGDGGTDTVASDKVEIVAP